MIGPLISIVAPVYNNEAYLHAFIESVISQSYSNWEMVLVDDCSKDRSSAICDEYSHKDKRISVIHHLTNEGICKARNTGIIHTKGEWILLLDSDDTLLPGSIISLVECISDDIDLVSASYLRYVEGVLQKENKDFLAFLISGDYIYADGHVVRNEPRFVHEKDSKFFLTDEARKQVDACCLRFSRQYVQKGVGQYVYGRMFYDPQYVAQTKFYLNDIINERHLDDLDARMAYRDEFPRTFVGAFDMLMKKNGETRESVAPLLHTTERSLHDWLYNPERKISRDFIVYISLMWKVPDWISSLLLKTVGLNMLEHDRRHQALEHILTVLWDQGIDEANKYLTSNGLEPLAV